MVKNSFLEIDVKKELEVKIPKSKIYLTFININMSAYSVIDHFPRRMLIVEQSESLGF